jgi:transcriptional/translational regulatory protein YebC/TACO1
VKKALEAKGIKVEHADLQMIPQNLVKVEGKDAEHLLKLMEALEDHDDIQHVYANFDIDDSILAAFNS